VFEISKIVDLTPVMTLDGTDPDQSLGSQFINR
jgi:hypothetical protein